MSKLILRAKGLYKLYQKAEISSLSASLAFHSLLSFIPILTLGLWYLSHAGFTELWLNQLKNYLVSHFQFTETAKVSEYLNLITQNVSASSWGWVGLFVFVYTTFNLLLSIGHALDYILKAREAELSLDRSALQTWSRRLLFLVLLPSFLIFSSSFMSWIREDSWIRVIFEFDTVGPWLARPIPWMIDFASFFLLYHYIPNTKVTARQAARASLFTTPLFILGKWGMGHYSAYALTTQKIYGAFAVVPLLMLWVYWAWIIILTGALLIKHSPKKNFQQDS